MFYVPTEDKGLNKLDSSLLSCLIFLLFPLKGSKVYSSALQWSSDTWRSGDLNTNIWQRKLSMDWISAGVKEALSNSVYSNVMVLMFWRKNLSEVSSDPLPGKVIWCLRVAVRSWEQEKKGHCIEINQKKEVHRELLKLGMMSLGRGAGTQKILFSLSLCTFWISHKVKEGVFITR